MWKNVTNSIQKIHLSRWKQQITVNSCLAEMLVSFHQEVSLLFYVSYKTDELRLEIYNQVLNWRRFYGVRNLCSLLLRNNRNLFITSGFDIDRKIIRVNRKFLQNHWISVLRKRSPSRFGNISSVSQVSNKPSVKCLLNSSYQQVQ